MTASKGVCAVVAERCASADIAPSTIRKDGFTCSACVYTHRGLIKRLRFQIKHFRGLATRDHRAPDTILAALGRVGSRSWLAWKRRQHPEEDPRPMPA